MRKILIFLVFVSLLLTLPIIFSGNFYFDFNAGQDAFLLKDIIQLKKIYLIAPWSSLSSLFQGAFYYYVSLIPFILWRGNPAALVLVSCLAFSLTILIGFWFVSKNFSKTGGLIFALLALFSPVLGQLAITSGAENLIPFIFLLFLVSLYQAVKNSYFLLLAFLLAGLSFHFQPIVGFQLLGMMFIFLLIPAVRKIALRTKVYGLLLFGTSFLPQIFFDWRHQLLQTKNFVLFIKGQAFFGQASPITLRFWEKIVLLAKFWQETLAKNEITAWVIFFIFFYWIIFGLEKMKGDKKVFIKLLLLFLIFTFIFYFIIFPFSWPKSSFYPLIIIFIFLSSFSLTWLLAKVRKSFWLILTAAFLVITFVINLDLTQKYAVLTRGWGNHNFIKSKETALDWIYKDAQGSQFKLYFYTPTIYDFSWQYLVFWYALEKYQYLPQEFAYAPGVPDYVPNKNIYLSKIKPANQPSQSTYILFEPDTLDHWGVYMKNFDNLGSQEEKIEYLPSGIVIKQYQTKKDNG